MRYKTNLTFLRDDTSTMRAGYYNYATCHSHHMYTLVRSPRNTKRGIDISWVKYEVLLSFSSDSSMKGIDGQLLPQTNMEQADLPQLRNISMVWGQVQFPQKTIKQWLACQSIPDNTAQKNDRRSFRLRETSYQTTEWEANAASWEESKYERSQNCCRKKDVDPS